MSFIGKIELASNVASLTSGQIPASFGFRVFSMFFGRKKRLTKSQRKKLMMRKRRMFVDNVIMHHRRLHDQNREKIIEKTKAEISKKPKERALSKPGNAPKIRRDEVLAKKLKPKQGEQYKTHIKGAMDNVRQKSRSRWAVRVRDGSKSSQEI